MNGVRASCYSIFHLNLAYSSIELTQRPVVIERCYWPLLELAASTGLRPGIELSGSTLTELAQLAPDWVAELRRLLRAERCELIGSGYAQLIGPLVPADVNAANLRFGLDCYRTHLGVTPSVALVNEQAYSAGLVPLYLDAGFHAIAMEWNNPAAHHPEWSPTLRDAPQRARGADGRDIALLWIDTVAFQQLQRYAHAELELDEYRAYLERRLGSAATSRVAFPFYGNDAEIFDFRPGRFHTEPAVDSGGEWCRLRALVTELEKDERFGFALPSRVLDSFDEADAPGTPLELTSAEAPIPVKKQEKYNVTRWAVTGRNDLEINTACWRLLRALRASPELWSRHAHELCRFWSSDFRTHITADRWHGLRAELAEALARHTPAAASWTHERDVSPRGVESLAVQRRGRWLEVRTDRVHVVLDCRRGAAIRSLHFLREHESPLIGTIPHGHYEDLSLAADFYTGHTVVEFPGDRRVTDLSPVTPDWTRICSESSESQWIRVTGSLETPLGPIGKRIDVSCDQAQLRWSIDFDWDHPRRGTFRTGFVTVLPDALERASLFYRTHNGGSRAETFPLAGTHVRHGSAVSALVSARGGLGATEGSVVLGDAHRALSIRFDPARAAALPMVEYRDVGTSYWLRLMFSLGELDETRALLDLEEKRARAPSFSLEIRPEPVP